MPVPAALSPSGEALPGRWRGWWEGVVDLVPDGRPSGGPLQRKLSLEKVFGRGVPKPFPEASESVLRFILPENESMSARPERSRQKAWIDGRHREVIEWDLKDATLQGEDIAFDWEGEHEFSYRMSPNLCAVIAADQLTND